MTTTRRTPDTHISGGHRFCDCGNTIGPGQSYFIKTYIFRRDQEIAICPECKEYEEEQAEKERKENEDEQD